MFAPVEGPANKKQKTHKHMASVSHKHIQQHRDTNEKALLLPECFRPVLQHVLVQPVPSFTCNVLLVPEHEHSATEHAAHELRRAGYLGTEQTLLRDPTTYRHQCNTHRQHGMQILEQLTRHVNLTLLSTHEHSTDVAQM